MIKFIYKALMVLILFLVGSFTKSYAQRLGNNKGDFLEINSFVGTTHNMFYNKLWVVRDANGPDWFTTRLHDGVSVDYSFLEPMVNTRTWWERDPYNNIQSWGHASQTYLTIAGGNVGIGTTNPRAKLSVEGGILAKLITIKTDISVPDYVFEPDYKMLSLSQVEDFVKEHKHLPEIPSASEISENGLDLAAINLLLLKKVEELTLHLIEKEKIIDRQQNTLDEINLRLAILEQ